MNEGKDMADGWRMITDEGPIYHETDVSQFIVEPWNAFSSLLFLVPVIYFLFLLRGQYKANWFLIYLSSPLLVIGGIGSTIYHAFRASRFFIFMDFLPIAILTLSISIFLWIKILPKWWYVIFIILLSFGLRSVGFYYYEGQTGINISYFITGVMIFLPALLVLFRTRFFKVNYLLLAIVFFILALFFRYADDWETPLLYMGTHWVWHLCTAIGSLFLGLYIKYLVPLSVKRMN